MPTLRKRKISNNLTLHFKELKNNKLKPKLIEEGNNKD